MVRFKLEQRTHEDDKGRVDDKKRKQPDTAMKMLNQPPNNDQGEKDTQKEFSKSKEQYNTKPEPKVEEVKLHIPVEIDKGKSHPEVNLLETIQSQGISTLEVG